MRNQRKGFFALIFGALLFSTWKSDAPKESQKGDDTPMAIVTDYSPANQLIESEKDIVAEIKPPIVLKRPQPISEKVIDVDTLTALPLPYSDSLIPKTKAKVSKGEIIDICGCTEPRFPGGVRMMKEFIAKNIVYPSEDLYDGIQGRVYLDFIINEDGLVTNVTVKRGVSPAIDAEAIRVIESMPAWQPAFDYGKGTQSTRIRIPISFKIV